VDGPPGQSLAGGYLVEVNSRGGDVVGGTDHVEGELDAEQFRRQALVHLDAVEVGGTRREADVEGSGHGQ
jgi:hypothetical protein